MADVVEVYESPDGWRWRRKAPNGEIIAEGEAYTRMHDGVEGAHRANPDVATVTALTGKDDG